MLLITVPKPCHEDWNKMTPVEKGAYCKACAKTVVDFTSMTDDEVKNYFISNASQKTCGHFRSDQLADSELAGILNKPIPLWKKFLAMLLILFGSLLTGCNDKTTGKTDSLSIIEGSSAPASGVAEMKKLQTDTTTGYKRIKSYEVVCSTVDGFAAPVVMEISGEPLVEEGLEMEKIDTVGKVTDSVAPGMLQNKNCKLNGKDTSIFYYEP